MLTMVANESGCIYSRKTTNYFSKTSQKCIFGLKGCDIVLYKALQKARIESLV